MANPNMIISPPLPFGILLGAFIDSEQYLPYSPFLTTCPSNLLGHLFVTLSAVREFVGFGSEEVNNSKQVNDSEDISDYEYRF